MQRVAAALLVSGAVATHYEDPKTGCGSDEKAIRVQGVSGDFCSPECQGTTCPTDPPSASDAKPQCALKSPTGDQYCALLCTPGSNAACPEGATCQPIQGVGLCTYPSAGLKTEVHELAPASEVSVEKAKCTGSADPTVTGPVCYEGSAGALGVKETVDVHIESFASGKGTMDLTGKGITGITCAKHSFSKSGQAITADLSDCLPGNVAVNSINYCSDQDAIQVTVKDKSVPFPITATLTKTSCPSLQMEAAKCTGSADPTVTAPVCYQGAAGALGVKETVDVRIESFASGKGAMDLTGKGITSIKCAKHSFSKSGQAISTDLSDCLPGNVAVNKINYCSDQDAIQVTVKDSTVPIPITATLQKVACSSTEETVVV